jgi:hypothetical protein
MSDTTWSDIAYQERHGVLPDKGMTASEMQEYYGDMDPDEVRESVRHVAESRLSEENRALRRRVAELERELAGDDTLTCHECGQPFTIDSVGVATHDDDESPDGIDHDADEDHVPFQLED